MARKIMYATPSGAAMDKEHLSQYLASRAGVLPAVHSAGTTEAGLGRLADQVRVAPPCVVAIGQMIRLETRGGQRTRRGEVDRITFDRKGALVVEVWSSGQTRFLARREGSRWVQVRRTW